MTARTETAEAAMDARPPFNAELFEERCKALGANTEEEKAALAGVNASTLFRFRRGDMGPRLEVARRLAQRLGVSVDDLWPVT